MLSGGNYKISLYSDISRVNLGCSSKLSQICKSIRDESFKIWRAYSFLKRWHFKLILNIASAIGHPKQLCFLGSGRLFKSLLKLPMQGSLKGWHIFAVNIHLPIKRSLSMFSFRHHGFLWASRTIFLHHRRHIYKINFQFPSRSKPLFLYLQLTKS